TSMRAYGQAQNAPRPSADIGAALLCATSRRQALGAFRCGQTAGAPHVTAQERADVAVRELDRHFVTGAVANTAASISRNTHVVAACVFAPAPSRTRAQRVLFGCRDRCAPRCTQAVVAVPATLGVEALAEVVEHYAPAAEPGLRIEHHALELLAVAFRFIGVPRCQLRNAIGVEGRVFHRDAAAGTPRDHPGVSKELDSDPDLGLRDGGQRVAQRGERDEFVVWQPGDRLLHRGDLACVRIAVGEEEALHTLVAQVVEERALRHVAVAAGAARFLVVRLD